MRGWMTGAVFAAWLGLPSLGVAGPYERPLAIGVDRAPLRAPVPERLARPERPPVRPSGVVEIQNPSRHALYVQIDGHGFWMAPWERTAVRVQAGSVNLDTSVSRRGYLVPVESRAVWVDPAEEVWVELAAPRRSYAPPRLAVTVHTGAVRVYHHTRYGHHRHHW